MLDIDLETGYFIDDQESSLKQAVELSLQTSFGDRIFNPGIGTNGASLLMKVTSGTISEITLRALLKSAVTRSIPNADISLDVNIESQGNGTAIVYVDVAIDYQDSQYEFTYSSDRRKVMN